MAQAQTQKYELRKRHILHLLESRDSLSVDDIAGLLDISQSSARRFCAALEDDGVAIRYHGGIRHASAAQIYPNYQFADKKSEHVDEKERIAKMMADLIDSDKTLFLTSGSSVYYCAIEIGQRITNNTLSGLKIYTNSYYITNLLSPITKVTLVGGIYRPERSDTVGPIAERQIRNLRLDISILGTDSASIKRSFRCNEYDTAVINKALISQSKDVMIPLCSEKFDASSQVSFATVKDITHIVTDSAMPDSLYSEYAKEGVLIYRA